MIQFYVGGYGHESDKTIHLVEVENEKLKVQREIITTQHPSFIQYDKSNNTLLAVDEQYPCNGDLVEISLDQPEKVINQHSSLGSAPCHFTLSPSAIYVSNYGGGNIVKVDREQFKAVAWSQHYQSPKLAQRAGINKERQNDPHPHSTLLSNCGKYLIAADLGLDQLTVYQSETLEKLSVYQCLGGSGPRHMAFSQDGNMLYLTCELSNQVEVLTFNQQALEHKQLISSIPEDFNDESYTAEIKLIDHHLYVSNRGHNSIAHFNIKEDGSLSLEDFYPCGGNFPRHFDFSEQKDYVMIANQLSNNVTLLKRDIQTGSLSEVLDDIDLPMPVYINVI